MSNETNNIRSDVNYDKETERGNQEKEKTEKNFIAGN